MELLHRHVVAVHEEVQQVDGQVSGCGAQPEVAAEDGQEVREVPPEGQLRGLASVGRQLQLLLDNKDIMDRLLRPELYLETGPRTL